MKYINYFLIIFIFLFIKTENLLADDKYCIDKEGLILPLFDENECFNKTDIIINLEEFTYIIEFDASERLSKLQNFKENKDELLKAKGIENTEDIKSIDEKKELEKKKSIDIAKSQNEKRIALQKEIELKKAKRLEKIEKRKKELEEKRAAEKARQEQLKAERLKKIEKRKKELEEKRVAEKARQEQLKAEKIEKKKQKEKLDKIKKELAKKNKQLEIQQNDNVNDVLKIVFNEKQIVKKELLPNINPSGNIDIEIVDQLNLEQLNNYLSNNSNLIFIFPKDFDTFSTVISEENLTSQMVAGSRSVPNPEFNRLQAEMRRTERELQRAQAEAERGFQMSQCISCGLITQWGGIALQEKWQNEGAKLQRRLNNLISSYSNTPDYLEKELLRSYSYLVQNIEAEKKAIYQVVQFKNNKLFEKNVFIESNKSFKVAYNIDPQDKKYESLLNKYSTTNEVTNWQNQKIKGISIDELINLIDKENNFRDISTKNELYALLNFNVEEELSWWEKLLGTSKKKSNKKSVSLNSGSSFFEEKDERFDSVVIVKTENGLGSGFFISKDEILTNYHVIENSSSISVTDKNKKRSSAIVIKKDLRRDLALLKTNSTGKPVKFFEGQLKQGEMVEALGHPKGRKFSLTKGWISAIRKESSVYSATGTPDVLFIQTDAAINPGNSGGPLFYKDRVVGVNTQGLHKDTSEGMNFAVHFSEVNQFLSN